MLITERRWLTYFSGFVIMLSITAPISASDGVVEINQTRAVAGDITPGDAPGFPVSISQKGSYKLTGNLTVPNVNTSGIVITVDDVTLDLNGFSIIGPSTPAGPDGFGIGVRSDQRSVVFNGTVRGMGDTGIQLGRFSRAERLQVIANRIGLAASDSLISEINANENRLDGISVGNGSTIVKCVVNDNLRHGINVGVDSNVSGNMVKDNHGIGILMNSGTVLQNTIVGNSGLGLSLGATAGYAQNVVTFNNGSTANPQVSGGIQIGTNICGEDTSCP